MMMLVLGGSLLLPTQSAMADSPGCVTEGEYLRVADGMTKTRVHNRFDTTGTFADGGAGGYAREYPRCHSDNGTVIVEYADPPEGPGRVASKRWRSPDAGDVRVLLGDGSANSFDLVNRPRRQDHVRARGGRDYVFMQRNGLRDVIRCGAGKDLVHYLDARERRDVYIGCERVVLYSP
jgi:hypothetical protein